MKIKSEKDFWSGLMFVVVGVVFAWGATTYSFGSSARPGPGYFPFGLGIILALIGALILFESLTIEVEGGEKIGEWPLKQSGVILGAVALFGLLLPKIGMAVALPVLIIVSSLASGEFNWKEVLLNSVILTVGSWAIFIKGLGLTIPLWPAFLTA
ncbi:MAG: tripartite tricarboxylate transporter TctB family protein [Rubrivivax sp.]|nr:tripartite tricarboxylate transporter TctB family protein [Rubrivivax sp.]